MFTVLTFEKAPSTARPILLSISLLALLSLADLAKVCCATVTDRNKAAKIKEIIKTAADLFNLIGRLEGNYIKFRSFGKKNVIAVRTFPDYSVFFEFKNPACHRTITIIALYPWHF